MSKKLYASFLPLLAVAAFAALPAAAQAASPQWYSNGTKIKEGTSVKVTTSSRTAKVKLEEPATGLYSEGILTDAGTIVNPTGGGAGEDSITSFSTASNVSNICPVGSTTEVTATDLPWATLLSEPSAGVFRDTISDVEVDVSCSGTLVAVFEGTLTPKFVNSTTSDCSGATDSYVEFLTEAAGGGDLVNAATGGVADISGKDYIEGPTGDHCITVKS